MKPEPFKRRAFIRNNVAANVARLRAALSQPVQAQPAPSSSAMPGHSSEIQAGKGDKARQLS